MECRCGVHWDDEMVEIYPLWLLALCCSVFLCGGIVGAELPCMRKKSSYYSSCHREVCSVVYLNGFDSTRTKAWYSQYDMINERCSRPCRHIGFPFFWFGRAAHRLQNRQGRANLLRLRSILAENGHPDLGTCREFIKLPIFSCSLDCAAK
jgi:hypothetical protein